MASDRKFDTSTFLVGSSLVSNKRFCHTGRPRYGPSLIAFGRLVPSLSRLISNKFFQGLGGINTSVYFNVNADCINIES